MDTGHHLLAVMPDTESAERLAQRLRDEGVSADSIHVDDARDDADALRAEMAAEMNDAVVAPQAVFIASKEGVRGTALFTLIGSIVALIVTVPIAFIDVGLNYWARFVIEASFLIFMVFLIAYVLGGAWAWNPEQKMAAERGVVLRIRETSPRITDLVIEAGPIRVDEVAADGAPLSTVHTEGSDADEQMMPKVEDTIDHIRDAMDEQRRADPTDHT
jgi:membrane protein YdbS with pleckstrin-like domain